MTDSAISNALRFLDSIRVDDTRSEYYEVAEKNHSEYRVYNQSQYLISILFNRIGRKDIVQAIRSKHPPDERDNDPRRRKHKAFDRFCILEGNTENFYLAKKRSSSYNDELALIALYWLEREKPKSANNLWKRLYSKYDPDIGFLKMDKADSKRNLYPLYKVALLGILAKGMKKMDIVNKIQNDLRKWQHPLGGWVTDRTKKLRPDGVANIETTVLCSLALMPD